MIIELDKKSILKWIRKFKIGFRNYRPLHVLLIKVNSLNHQKLPKWVHQIAIIIETRMIHFCDKMERFSRITIFYIINICYLKVLKPVPKESIYQLCHAEQKQGIWFLLCFQYYWNFILWIMIRFDPQYLSLTLLLKQKGWSKPELLDEPFFVNLTGFLLVITAQLLFRSIFP